MPERLSQPPAAAVVRDLGVDDDRAGGRRFEPLFDDREVRGRADGHPDGSEAARDRCEVGLGEGDRARIGRVAEVMHLRPYAASL